MLSTERIQQTFTSMHWASAACAASLRPHNTHKCFVVSSQDGEGQLDYSRESSAQVEEMTRAWQEVSGAGSLLHSPSLATLAATPVSGKPAYTHTRARALYHSTVEELMLRVLRKQRKHCCGFFFFSLSDKTFLTK